MIVHCDWCGEFHSGSCCHPDRMQYDLLIEENRALQAKLEEAEKERDRWNENHKIMCRVEHDLRQQLAAAQDRVKDAEKTIANLRKEWDERNRVIDALRFESGERKNFITLSSTEKESLLQARVKELEELIATMRVLLQLGLDIARAGGSWSSLGRLSGEEFIRLAHAALRLCEPHSKGRGT